MAREESSSAATIAALARAEERNAEMPADASGNPAPHVDLHDPVIGDFIMYTKKEADQIRLARLKPSPSMSAAYPWVRPRFRLMHP